MPELRWTLLILGALFIGALAFWELRRQKHARGQDVGATQGRDGERVSPTMDEGDASVPRMAGPEKGRGDLRVFREPTLTLPDLHLDAHGSRAPVVNPRVVELDEASLASLKVEPHTVVDEFSPAASDADEGAGASDSPLAPPDFPVQPPSEEALSAAEEEAAERGVEALEEVEEREERGERGERDEAEDVAEDDFDAITPTRPPPNPAPTLTTVYADAEPPVVVDWPDESARKIIALRLISGTGERFQGRAVRLALAAEGFQIGKFEIFHKPGPGGRAVMSAASLSKPGTFSLNTMDGQRYGGLSLFAVLPGPLSPVEAFDELLLTARSLNDRLRGALQDERGEPLTPVRSASIRDSLASSPSSTPS